VSVSPYEYLPAGRGIPSILSRQQTMSGVRNVSITELPRTPPPVQGLSGRVLSPNNLSQYYVEIVHVELCHCQCLFWLKYQYF